MSKVTKSVVLPVVGFFVREYKSVQSTKEDDPGKVRIILEANKEDIKTVEGHNVGDVLAALNLHQEAVEPVAMQVRFIVEEEA
jgi:hypothetical protein